MWFSTCSGVYQECELTGVTMFFFVCLFVCSEVWEGCELHGLVCSGVFQECKMVNVVWCLFRCISGTLEAKTRILVTRNLHILKAANRIAVLREVRHLAMSYIPLALLVLFLLFCLSFFFYQFKLAVPEGTHSFG